MRHLKDLGRGLPLYGALLVLPAVFLMVLHGWGLYGAYQVEKSAIPLRAEHNRLRLEELLHERFSLFIDSEQRRPYFQYGAMFSPDESVTGDLVLLPSPLMDEAAPTELDGWFQADFSPTAPDNGLKLIPNRSRARRDGNTPAELQLALEDLLNKRGTALGSTRSFAPKEHDSFEIPVITAAVHADRARHEDCLKSCLPIMQGRYLEISMTRFSLLLFRDSGRTLRLVALRRVVPGTSLPDLYPNLPKGGLCMDALRDGFDFMQGFFIDPGWAFAELPMELAPVVLDQDAKIAVGNDARRPANPEELKKTLDLDKLFRIERSGDLVEPHLNLALFTDATGPRDRFQASTLRFGAVAVMLILSLGTGLFLLTTNVRQKLEQARRTENFVAAVTHELRTPLASIRLHGEMLQDGIPSTAEARGEYYNRILGETERLSLLVENVLEKSRLDSERKSSKPGDLSDLVARLETELRGHGFHFTGAENDLAFDLGENLPEVYLHVDALNGILRNLIGNARKYAPVSGGDGPILVRTRVEAQEVLLEVLDRGPGVPAGEEESIFEAFFRVGDEATREKPGTGLGLHLVKLHADALRAHVAYHPRKGGGSVFRVSFPFA